MKKTYEIFSGKELEVADAILRRRMQMLMHSYIYYKMDMNLISDREFEMWGKDLGRLHADYPENASQVEYAEAFKDWDASTGFHLPANEQIVRIAHRLTHRTSVKPKPQVSPKVSTKKTNGRKSLF